MKPPSLLIVEDDALLVEALVLRFESSGFTVRVAPNGEEALAQVGADRPDVILLDIVMPRCDGVQFLRRLRPIAPDLPVIVMTNLDKEEVRKECLELGVREYLFKSDLSLAELERRVLAHVQKT